MLMSDCTECKYAEYDYEEYYGTRQKQWFVCGCKKGYDIEQGCKEEEDE